MFPLSLSSAAFTWFTSLAPNSIFTWAQLEQKFKSTFILMTLSLDYLILLPSNKRIMSLSPITLGGLGILETGVLI
jgi:hypothetical protein